MKHANVNKNVYIGMFFIYSGFWSVLFNIILKRFGTFPKNISKTLVITSKLW